MNEKLQALDTPAAIIDHARMQANVRRLQRRMDALGVGFRPHVKTSKCTPVALAQLAAGARGSAAIYTEHLSLIHIIRKVLLRVASYLDYIIIKHSISLGH